MIHNFTRNRLRAVSFSKTALFDCVTEFVSPYGPVQTDQHLQLNYIANYLENSLGCRLFIIEDHYIDREYMDSFASYYAKCLRPYPNYCKRLHFFDKQFDLALVARFLSEATGKSKPEDQGTVASAQAINRSYLGFVVVRPQNQSFVGNSVLCPLPDADGRSMSCKRRYEVNLLGLNLRVDGLAFQQQDRAVSACASAALWSALHKTAFDEAIKIPSTVEITAGATRFSVEGGRSFPSTGLTIPQMCEAVRASGLEPELRNIRNDPALCRVLLHTYLRSRIPVIALLNIDGLGGHAVTVLGFREPGTQPTHGVPQLSQFRQIVSTRLRGSAIPECYVHDDRIGPYAHVIFTDSDETTKDGQKKPLTRVAIEYQWSSPPGRENAIVEGLLIPIYPKMRLSYDRIFKWMTALIEQLSASVPGLILQGDELETCFLRGRDYKNEYAARDLPLQDRFNFLALTSFPRWVGVARLFRGPVPVFDVLLDTTESDLGFPILGIVLLDKNALSLQAQLKAQPFLFPIFP